MFKMNFVVALGLLLVSLWGCASTSSVAPEWVTNPDGVYDSDVYLWAVGSGSNRKIAENDALSLLVRSIQQTVASTTEASKKVAGNDAEGFAVDYDFAGQVATASSIKDVPGVSFPQSWVAGNGTVYMLALLNREEAGRFYRQKISDLSAVVESELLFASSNEGTFEALAALRAAATAAGEQQGYIDMLAGIHPDLYRIVSLDYVSVPAVEALERRHQEKIQIAVEVAGDSNGRVAAILEGVLTDNGLKVAKGAAAKSARYLLQGTVVMEPRKNDSKYHYVRFVANVNLHDLNAGKTLFPYSKNGREAHVTHEEAVQRAYRTIENTLRKEFVPQLWDFLQAR